MYTNADCTVYNRIYDPTSRQDRWQRTALSGVLWESQEAVSVVKGGLAPAGTVSNTTAVYIPFRDGYLPPKRFSAVPGGSWTIQKGDRVVKGVVDLEIEGGKISALEQTYDDVITVTSVDAMDYGSRDMWHWQIGGQ